MTIDDRHRPEHVQEQTIDNTNTQHRWRCDTARGTNTHEGHRDSTTPGNDRSRQQPRSRLMTRDRDRSRGDQTTDMTNDGRAATTSDTLEEPHATIAPATTPVADRSQAGG